ncbi:Metallo-dependent phosphatase [Lojkania enalia]|uniref:Metallo-dependent phosphatase n=1 Tax=Lojkania enalia TaxID=147567 RepID=A0A9P4NBE9_9PLEO|nr:Metallo-dependent phosphatase [Didymosphaeria enalia]
MSYPAHRHGPSQPPLIDLIPTRDLHVSDEEDTFYLPDDDYIVHPYYRAILAKAHNRIPRRIRRHLFICLSLLVLLWLCWWRYLGPAYYDRREMIRQMDNEPKDQFGANKRPEFKDLIMIKDLAEKHLPKGEGRLVIVGDVHGCRKELEELLEKVGFREGKDHLILTGDIISKGPDSAGVVTLAEKMDASCVRGNHEDKLLLSVAESNSLHASLLDPEERGLNTNFLDKESFPRGNHKLRKLAKSLSKANIRWLQSCPVILRVGQIPNMGKVVVVHAGLVPGIKLEQQDPFQCMNMRTIDLKTRIPSENREHTPWEIFWNRQQEKLPNAERSTVIYGHDRKRGKNIREYSKGLDSGCVSGGHLTALVIDEHGGNGYVGVRCKGYVD